MRTTTTTTTTTIMICVLALTTFVLWPAPGIAQNLCAEWTRLDVFPATAGCSRG